MNTELTDLINELSALHWARAYIDNGLSEGTMTSNFDSDCPVRHTQAQLEGRCYEIATRIADEFNKQDYTARQKERARLVEKYPDILRGLEDYVTMGI